MVRAAFDRASSRRARARSPGGGRRARRRRCPTASTPRSARPPPAARGARERHGHELSTSLRRARQVQSFRYSIAGVLGGLAAALAVPLNMKLDGVEQRFILAVYEQAGGNKTLAAKLLGITYDSLRYQVKKYGLE